MKKLKLCPTCGELDPRITGHFQWGLKRAAREKLTVVEPAQNELQIDIDSGRSLRKYSRQKEILDRAGITKGWKEKLNASRTPGHCHITITLPRPMPILERIGLAAILGDDPPRAAFNYARAKNKNSLPVVFFERNPKCIQKNKSK